MFTGIVTDIGEIIAVDPRAEGLRRLKIACRYERSSIAEGASIACSGVCMTVVDIGQENGRTWFSVDAAAETLRLTTVGRWAKGTKINLERALKMGDELGGHVVAGHVDGLATLVSRHDMTDMARRFIATKGSVTLNGVALTVNEVEDDTFSVLIIPHTLQVTTLGLLAVRDTINLEVDLMARYTARLLETAQQ
jgi:riboflavin synthase